MMYVYIEFVGGPKHGYVQRFDLQSMSPPYVIKVPKDRAIPMRPLSEFITPVTRTEAVEYALEEHHVPSSLFVYRYIHNDDTQYYVCQGPGEHVTTNNEPVCRLCKRPLRPLDALDEIPKIHRRSYR